MDPEEIFLNIDEGISHVKKHHPHILLVDMYGSLKSKFDVANKLKSIKSVDIKVVIITEQYHKQLFKQLLKNNCWGFINKELKASEILMIIRAVFHGQIVICKELSNQFIKFNELQRITEKKLNIINLISQEKTNKEIAKILNYAPSTVEYYVTNIINKLSVQTRFGAVSKAKDLNLL